MVTVVCPRHGRKQDRKVRRWLEWMRDPMAQTSERTSKCTKGPTKISSGRGAGFKLERGSLLKQFLKQHGVLLVSGTRLTLATVADKAKQHEDFLDSRDPVSFTLSGFEVVEL